MAQLTIVTTPTNSGDGTPLSTAFNYCNSNFSELYSRVQYLVPGSLIGCSQIVSKAMFTLSLGLTDSLL